MAMEINQESVERFREVCEVDEVRALQYLTHCDGHLETAIQLFFQTGGTLQNTYEGENNRENEERELRRRNVNNENQSPSTSKVVASSSQSRPTGWIQWLSAIITLPFRFTVTTLWDIFTFLSELVLGGTQRSITVADARGDVGRFIEAYSANTPCTVRNPFTFMQSSYNEALREAKTSLRSMVVYLHNPNIPDCEKFINEQLNSQEFSDLVAANNLIVWGVSITSQEGVYVSTSLRSRVYPFVGLVVQKNNKMLLALKMEGSSFCTNIVGNMRMTLMDHEQNLANLREQKRKREEDQRLRQEQEREYKESADKDRARIQERRRLESEKQEAEEKVRELERKAEQRRLAVVNHRAELQANSIEQHTGPDAVHVQVRFPSGVKFEHRFGPDDTLEKLFHVTLSHSACPDFITLHTSYPRSEINCAPEWYVAIRAAQLNYDAGNPSDEFCLPSFVPVKTFRQSGLEKSLVVMVQDCLA